MSAATTSTTHPTAVRPANGDEASARARRTSYDQILEVQRERLTALAARSVRHEDAEDLAQETLIRAYTALSDYEGEWSVPAMGQWLRAILRHVIADHYRTRQLRAEIDLGSVPETLLTDCVSPAERSEQWRLMRAEIERLMQSCPLTFAQRVCIAARLQGDTQPAIAARLRISQPAVSQHTRAGVALLKRAAEDSPMIDLYAGWFRSLCRVTCYHRPRRRGAYIAAEKLRRLR